MKKCPFCAKELQSEFVICPYCSESILAAAVFINQEKVKIDIGFYQQVIDECDKEIQLKPLFAEAFWTRGDAFNHLGDFPRAMQNYDHACNLNPEYGKCCYDRGLEYYRNGCKQIATEYFQIAAESGNEQAKAMLSTMEQNC